MFFAMKLVRDAFACHWSCLEQSLCQLQRFRNRTGHCRFFFYLTSSPQRIYKNTRHFGHCCIHTNINIFFLQCTLILCDEQSLVSYNNHAGSAGLSWTMYLTPLDSIWQLILSIRHVKLDRQILSSVIRFAHRNSCCFERSFLFHQFSQFSFQPTPRRIISAHFNTWL